MRLYMLIVACFLLILTRNLDAAIQCNGCHGTLIPVDYRPLDADFRNYSTGGFTGNHRTHMEESIDIGVCEKCHPSSSYLASHRDGSIKVSSRINSSSLTTSYNNTTSAFKQIAVPTLSSCSNVNCHFERTTPTWGSDPTLTNCDTCHGAPPSGTQSAYIGGAAGSHSKHYQYYPGTNNCKKCHHDNTTFSHATSAGKRALKISFAAAPNYGIGSYTGSLDDYLPSQENVFGTCTTAYCHSNAAGGAPNVAPTWGASLPADCTGCHGGAVGSASVLTTGRHSAHINNLAILGTNFGCVECHSKSVSDTTTISVLPNHVNSFIDFSGIRAGKSSTYNTSTGICSATYCHSDGKGTLKSMTTDNWKGATSLDCKGCHGSDAAPSFTSSAAGEPNYANSGGGLYKANSHQRHTIAGSASCDACHTNTTTNGTAIKANSTIHINGTFDLTFNTAKAGASVAWTAGSKTCSNILCHGTGSAPSQWGSTSCLGCHSVTQGKRAAVTGQFASNSHHIQVAITDAHCYQCHWESRSDGSINPTYHSGAAASGSAVDLVVYGAGVRPAGYNPGTFITYTANGTRSQIQKISSHCLGCHSDQNNSATPFGDGKTPRQYAWDNTSVDARYSQSAKTSWGKYTSAAYPNAAKKKIDKALSAHGNAGANQRGWNTTTGVDGAISNTSGAVAVQCYDCHNSHGSAASGITSRYSSATGRNKGGILKTTQRGFGGYSATYKPQAAGSAVNKDVRNPGASLCLDCHFSSTPTQAPLAVFKGYTTPWGYNSTFSATQGILGYWDSPFMGYSTAGFEQRYTFKKINPMKGGHFGASSPLSTQPTAQINGLCTPCHDPHGVSPTLGVNQKYSVPLLKGTWLTSPYKEDTAPAVNEVKTEIPGVGEQLPYHIDQNTFGNRISNTLKGVSQSDLQFGGLCLGCHPKTSLTNGSTHTWKDKNRIHESVKDWKSLNATKQHNYSCSKCHSVHTNSALPRLMVTNCLDSRHKGRMGSNGNPRLSLNQAFSGYGSGSGGGRIPGSSGGGGDGWGGPTQPPEYDYSKNAVTCHENPTTNNGANSNLDQNWNVVTPWAVFTPPSSPVLTPQLDLVTSGGNKSITFRWGSVATSSGSATEYLVEVSTISDFSTITYSSGWILPISYTVSMPVGTWYCRVTARDSSAISFQSGPSTTDTFTISYTPPVAPILTAQTNSASSGGAISKFFNWSVVVPTDDDPVQYRVEVSTSAANFSSLSFDTGWIAFTNWTQFIPVGAWKWRVTARDSIHTTAISAPSLVGDFSITLTPPAAPTLIAQTVTSYTSGTDKSLSFTWNSVTASDGDSCEYLAEVSANASFSPVSYTSGWQAGRNWTQLISTGNWYWRVKSRDSVHTTAVSNPSATGSFEIAYAAPAAPTLIAQPNHSSASNVNVTLQWNAVTPIDADPMEYYAEVSSTADFSIIAYQSAWQATTSWTQSIAPGSWYWRVKSRDSGHASAVSNPSTAGIFTISNAPLPPIEPVLIAQPNGNTGCTTAYTHNLQWNPVTAPDGHAVQYYLQLDTVSSFNSVNLQQPGWIAANSWTTPAPIATGTWYWRVKARDAVDTAMVSPYSTTGSFTDTDTYTGDCTCDSSCPKDSCPFVFVWDGDKYSYVTDIAGPVIGLPKNIGADGKEIHFLGHKLYQPSYIDLKDLKPDNGGNYRIKLREPLAEMDYVDEMKLLEVDYPQGYEILNSTSELTYRYGYVNPFKIYTIKDPHPPLSATDKEGRDILATVLKVDNNTAPAERDDLEYYTFDFGTVRNPAAAKLIIDGWTVFGPKYKKINVKQAVQPYLEVVDKNGTWVKAKSFGEPAGDLKRMVIDIADIFRSDDHRIRLHRGMRKEARWLIDRIMLDDSAPVPVKSRETSAIKADLLHGGNLPYDHVNLDHRMSAKDSIVPDDPAAYGTGRFTRYGDVRELIATTDDRFVLMRHGDDIELTFPGSAPPEKGIQRGFMLKTKLYYKPVRGSRNIEPLPFSGMGIYPYDESEESPRDQKHQDYRNFYNTREYRAHSLTSMLNEMWGLNEAQAGSIEAVPATVAADRGKSQQLVNGQEPGLIETRGSEPEVRLSLWQWLGNITSKALLSITAVLVWLKSLVGL